MVVVAAVVVFVVAGCQNHRLHLVVEVAEMMVVVVVVGGEMGRVGKLVEEVVGLQLVYSFR